MTAVKTNRASSLAANVMVSPTRRPKSRFLKYSLCVLLLFAYARWSGNAFVDIRSASLSSSESSSSTQPRPLTLEQTQEKRLFVHIGKAGGSSILIMVQKSAAKCQELSQASSPATTGVTGRDDTIADIKDQTCAIAQIPTQRVHLQSGQEKYSQYSQFLVNVRNPIDRLISWYNYELQSYNKEPRWQQGGAASTNFERLKSCFPQGIGQIVQEGLIGRTTGDSSNSSPSGLSFPECQQLAKDCLKGDIMCFGHNFYNYEVYGEDLLRWKQASSEKAIRVDVIRSEYSMQDFETIVDLWTLPRRQQQQNQTPPRPYQLTDYVRGLYGRVRTIEQYQPKAGSVAAKKNVVASINKTVSQEAVTALCRFLCMELITYKHLLNVADNLSPQEVQQSYQELDERCALKVDQVCGTTWEYRNVKQQKNVFDMPW